MSDKEDFANAGWGCQMFAPSHCIVCQEALLLVCNTRTRTVILLMNLQAPGLAWCWGEVEWEGG